MTDRELLELAAKAAGIKIDKSPYNGGGSGNTGFDILGNAILDWHNGKEWNPLTNDGDALRLAVKLKIEVRFSLRVTAIAEGFALAMEDFNGDLYAATRRAIVRAAAALGENIAPTK